MKYSVGEAIVLSHKDTGKHEVGVITNRRVKKGVYTYDIRTELGSGHIMIPVDDAKSYIFINSRSTSIWQTNGSTTNLRVDKNLGHTIANFSKDIVINERNFESANDFTFKAIGARSY